MHAIYVLTTLALCGLATAVPRPRFPSQFSPRQANDSDGASCGLADIQQPSSTLPPPSDGLSLVLIAQGSGTQNYTCTNASSTDAPVAIGALASLTNASCAAANGQLGNMNEDAAAIGMHFFVDTTTPDFDIIGLGNTELKKTASAAAPAATGGTANVPWLKLQAQAQGTTSSIKEVYRLNTEGGSAPATCEGQDPSALLQVDYKAQYWFYASNEELASIAAARRRRALTSA